jgi:ATP-dependent protease HslVU (ClpYQ) peptidase subunit
LTTLVMVKRDSEACMAAETLLTCGSMKQSARYLTSHDKILSVGDAYVGITGWAVTSTVLQSMFSDGSALPEIRTELELFEYSRLMHQRLKDEYFLNARPEKDEPYESSQITAFIMNRHGLFGLYSQRSVDRFERFAAAGSGARYALGAMYAAYELGLPVEDVARLGVEAGIEFDNASAGPITLKKMKLEA